MKLLFRKSHTEAADIDSRDNRLQKMLENVFRRGIWEIRVAHIWKWPIEYEKSIQLLHDMPFNEILRTNEFPPRPAIYLKPQFIDIVQPLIYLGDCRTIIHSASLSPQNRQALMEDFRAIEGLIKILLTFLRERNADFVDIHLRVCEKLLRYFTSLLPLYLNDLLESNYYPMRWDFERQALPWDVLADLITYTHELNYLFNDQRFEEILSTTFDEQSMRDLDKMFEGCRKSGIIHPLSSYFLDVAFDYLKGLKKNLE